MLALELPQFSGLKYSYDFWPRLLSLIFLPAQPFIPTCFEISSYILGALDQEDFPGHAVYIAHKVATVFSYCTCPYPPSSFPSTSCHLSVAGNPGFRKTTPAMGRHWRYPEVRPRGQGGASPICHFRWPSGLCRLSLPPAGAIGSKFHISSARGMQVCPRPSPAQVLLWLPSPHTEAWVRLCTKSWDAIANPLGHFGVPAPLPHWIPAVIYCFMGSVV